MVTFTIERVKEIALNCEVNVFYMLVLEGIRTCGEE